MLTWLILLAAEPLVDDFAGGGWARFDSTPGTLTVERGALTLVDAPGEPDWVTASRTYTVDFAATPWILIRVGELSDRGTVKLIRAEPYDKREVLAIDRPGLYAVDMTRELGWTGRGEVEVCLYAIGDRESITYESVKFAAAPTDDERARLAQRRESGNPRLRTAPFELVPLFGSCSYYYHSAEQPGLSVSFRAGGEPWQSAYPPVWVPEDAMYRGSIVRLAEDTPHELRITADDGTVLAQGEFRTRASQVPIARTIVLDEASFDGHLRITEAGTPDGWIKVVARPGFVLRGDDAGPLLELDGAKYVMLEGLTLRGGGQQAIAIRRCEQVRVVNCDIAGWGRVGTQRFDLNGMYYTADGQAINWDTAILVSRGVGTVIERCWIHDPRTTANSWYYAHPAGPQAVGIDRPQQTVIRWCDFIGSDEHRWNDAVEGSGNFDVDGGFNRDADIHGNLMCLANDDAIEIDGGQTNVRVFDNRFEACLCGISIQGCMSGPSYLFGNLLVNLGDERQLAGQTIKTSSHANGPSAVSYIVHNTCHGDSSDLRMLANLRTVAYCNLFAGRQAITGRRDSPRSAADYNLRSTGEPGDEPNGLMGDPGYLDPATGRFALRDDSPARGRGLRLDNLSPAGGGPVDLGALPFGADRQLPERPMPVATDVEQLTWTADETAAATPRTVTVTVGGVGFDEAYAIARNEADDWFSVSPESGRLRTGDRLTFTVRLHPERMLRRALYRGAFLIRLASGLSRPVMLMARTGYTQPVKPTREGTWIQYLEAESPSGGGTYEVADDAGASGGRYLRLAGAADADPAEYRFTVPRDGVYFVVLRVRSRESLRFAIDDGPLERAKLRAGREWAWSLAAHNQGMTLICLQPTPLTAGEHRLRLAPVDPVEVDLVALCDDPRAFE